MRILLVDDDAHVIQSLLAVLKTIPGHEVRAAANGPKAIEHATAWNGVDLLITDVVMDPMNGFALRDALLAGNPRLRTILVSGFDLSDYPDQTRGYPLLHKPVEASALIEAIQAEEQALAAPPVAVAAVPKVRAVAVAAAQPVAQASPSTVQVRVAAAQPVAAQARPVAAKAAPVQPAQGVPQVRAVAAQPPPVQAQPRAVPVPRAQPSGVAPAPVAAAVPTARVPTPRAPAPEPEPVAVATVAEEPERFESVVAGSTDESEGLIGQTIGAYQIVSQLGEGRWGMVYAAVQIAINRPVGLKVLHPSQAADEHSRSRFVADARAKAHVQHPSILSVYEAGESAGHIFYAHEYVDGHTLKELAASTKLPEPTLKKLARAIAEGMAYLHQKSIPHGPLDASSMYLAVDGQPRLANLATQQADQQLPVTEEIAALGRALISVAEPGPGISPAMRALMAAMCRPEERGLTAWGQIIQSIKSLEIKAAPTEADKISAQDRAAIALVEAARRQQKRDIVVTLLSIVTLTSLAGATVWWKFYRHGAHIADKMIAIPGGTYTVGSQKVSVEPFWIDKHEVTIDQYAKFLEYLQQNPTEKTRFNHPRQPGYIDHEPPNWSIFYGRAKLEKPVHSAPYSLDCPVVEVCWWDAYAYAKWRGGDLPTEAQWEAAARGTAGHVYPWGDGLDTKRVNSGADHNPNDPAAKGNVDGWNFWSPVDKTSGDKSEFGIIGMAGNVSEWSATWTPDNRFPVIKGGNYMSADVRLDKRVADRDPSLGDESIGFRIVRKTPPE